MEYSVIVPLKDEEANLIDLVKELEPVMHSLNKSWELICINDGSIDQTAFLLEDLQKTKPFLKVISFTKNYGQTSAFDAGFKAARGNFLITLDGDLQNDPQDIPKLLSYTDRYDLVVGWRKFRQDPFSKKIISKLANFIRSRLCQDGIHDTGCSLKVYRRTCFEKIKLFQGMHRFLPALFIIEGFKIVEVAVNHRERLKGVTKYNFFNRSFNTIADMCAVYWMRSRHLNYKIKS